MRAIEYKVIRGAQRQARLVDLISGIGSEPEIGKIFGDLAKMDTKGMDVNKSFPAICSAVHVVIGKHWETVCAITEMVTDITRDELNSDDEDAIGLENLIRILIKASEVNNIKSIMARLGNGQMPDSKKQTSGDIVANLAAQPKTSNPRFVTSSPALMGGAEVNLTK